MAQLIYAALMSLDGFTADESGRFEWAAPDQEVHSFVNDMERSVGTYLYGRRMYEVMRVWANPETFAEDDPILLDYAAVWQSADKVVFSTTLDTATTVRTTIERFFDPEAVRRIKADASSDVSVGGPEIAGQMLRAGLVDEVRFFIFPVLVGGGTRAFPSDFTVPLALVDQRVFDSGVVYVRYRVA